MHYTGMRCSRSLLAFGLGCLFASSAAADKTLRLDEAVEIAREQNPEIVIARKQLEAARGNVIEARAGYLPSVVSSGLMRKRESQEASRLREDDYNASVRVVQSLYSGGANKGRLAIARLLEEKRTLELAALEQRVIMDVRVAYYDLLLNQAKIDVRQQSVHVLRDELRVQQERLNAGTVGELNVRRAEVSLANEQPELFEAQTRLQNSSLRLHELLGWTGRAPAIAPVGDLQFLQADPDLNESLAHAAARRPEIRLREIDVEIEDHQLVIDRAATRPRVDAFTGYELYNERDPLVGEEFNHGYVIGLNASWHIFDGFATRGRMIATRARRDAALAALEAARLSVASDVRNAFYDLEQARRVLQSETRNVLNATESLELARSNLAAGFGTQLEVMQATTDVTRVRTTRLAAIHLHNVALARLARATARAPEEMNFRPRPSAQETARREAEVERMAQPPRALTNR